MDYYKNKFIKYKMKYLNLQSGGDKSFKFLVHESILPAQLVDLFPDNIINSIRNCITINSKNESDHIKLLNLIQQNNFVVCKMPYYNIVSNISDYDINAFKNAVKVITIFKIYKNESYMKNLSEPVRHVPTFSGQSASTPRSGQSASTSHSGQSASTPRSGQSASTPRSKAWGQNLWRMDFDSDEPHSQAYGKSDMTSVYEIDKRKTEEFKALASSTPRSKAWFEEIVSSSPRSQALREELIPYTPRSQALHKELGPSTPRSQALRKELVSSTPRSRASEYVSKKSDARFVENMTKKFGPGPSWVVRLKSRKEFSDLYNEIALLISQIQFTPYINLPQQLQLIIQKIKEIIDEKTFNTKESEQKKKVLDDIKINFFINSFFNDNIQILLNSVTRTVTFLQQIIELSKIIYEILDLDFDFSIEMDVEDDEDVAFDTALNLTFEDLIDPSNPRKVTLTNALEQIKKLRYDHAYKGCNPYPNQGDTDPLTGENLYNLHPSERISMYDKCYAVKSLYKWIIIKNNNQLPGIRKTITQEQKQRLIALYQKLNDCNPLPKPEDTDPITGENLLNLNPHERISIHDRCYAVKSLYEWIITKKNNELPRIKTKLSEEPRRLSVRDKQRLIQAYEIMI
jgi:hypothetical protein